METKLRDMEGIYRLSRYAHEFVNGEIVCLYHSLGMQTIYLSQSIWSKLKTYLSRPINLWCDKLNESERKAIEFLLDAFVLIPKEYNERTMLMHAKENCGWGKPEINVLYLMVTDWCNFDCTYCFIEAGIPDGYKFQKMSQQTSLKSIDLFARLNQTDKAKIVIFYGGEPLLNWPAIKKALLRIAELEEKKQLKGKTQRVVNTNGSLVTKEIAQELTSHQVTVAVSLDGPSHIHNAARIYAKNRIGTYEDAIRGYWLLKKAGCKTVISMTIAEHNIDKLESEVFPWLFDLEPEGIGYNLLLGSKRHPVIGKEFSEKATLLLIKLHELARQHGLGVERMLRKLQFFVHRWIYPNDCAGCGKQIVVAPNGQIGTCHAYVGNKNTFISHDFLTFDPVNHLLWKEWSQRSPLDFPECEDCSALGICGGGCAYNAAQLTGDIRGIDPAFCQHAKTILDWMIWNLYQIAKEAIPTTKEILPILTTNLV